MITIEKIKTATLEELDEILEKTEWAELGVAVGEEAAKDQDLRRTAQKEYGKRLGFED